MNKLCTRNCKRTVNNSKDQILPGCMDIHGSHVLKEPKEASHNHSAMEHEHREVPTELSDFWHVSFFCLLTHFAVVSCFNEKLNLKKMKSLRCVAYTTQRCLCVQSVMQLHAGDSKQYVYMTALPCKSFPTSVQCLKSVTKRLKCTRMQI